MRSAEDRQVENAPTSAHLRRHALHAKGASVRIPNGAVSLASVDGRIKTTCYFPPAFDRYTSWEVRASIIMYERKRKEFYIEVMVKKEAPPKREEEEEEEEDILGIDRGINKVAVCSNNIFFNSNESIA